MIRKCSILFCDNDHGSGDVTFPDVASMDAYEIQQMFINEPTLEISRRNAKQAGWGRVNGADYCPMCLESM
jgi:hypothetical protein